MRANALSGTTVLKARADRGSASSDGAQAMNVNMSVAAFGSAAIATPPTNDVPSAKPDDKPADSQQVTAAKSAGTGELVDKTA
jgi:hypothetical protein